MCAHIHTTQKWLGPKFDRWLAYSAMHKEIRRSDNVQALAWARILLTHQSEQSILKYIERIVFEESRAFTLWIKLRKKELSLNQAIEWMATARKKWELPYLNQHFNHWHKGFERAMSRPPPVPLELRQLLKTAQDPTDIYTLFFDLRRDPKLQPHFWSILADIATETKNERLATFLKYQPSTSYERMASLSLLIQLYGDEAKDRHRSNPTDRFFIPSTKKYHHDLHTAGGKALWINNFAHAWQEKCFEFGELCTNWSGSLFGVLFRERCYAQKGSMKKSDGSDWHWSNIEIGEIDYRKAWALENYYYSNITLKIQNRHPTLKIHNVDLLSI